MGSQRKNAKSGDSRDIKIKQRVEGGGQLYLLAKIFSKKGGRGRRKTLFH